VLVDTEKDGHRISFNDTFNEVLSILFLLCNFDYLFCILWAWLVWSFTGVGLVVNWRFFFKFCQLGFVFGEDFFWTVGL
jgi:hypothetical protein